MIQGPIKTNKLCISDQRQASMAPYIPIKVPNNGMNPTSKASTNELSEKDQVFIALNIANDCSWLKNSHSIMNIVYVPRVFFV